MHSINEEPLLYTSTHHTDNTHSNIKQFACTKCSLRFSEESRLAEHMDLHIDMDKEHKCDTCGAVLSSYASLKGHISENKIYLIFIKCHHWLIIILLTGSVHQRIGFHKCTVCQKEFTRRINWKRHLLTHTGEKREQK